MACGPAIHLTLQADENSSGAPEVQSSHKGWNKPVKLKLDGLLLPLSAKKMTQRELFPPRRNVMKEIQNKAAARKTLAAIPRPGPPSARRTSDSYKASFIVKPKNLVNRSRPSVGQAQYPSNRRDSKLYQRKTQGPIAPAYVRNTQKISGGSTTKADTKIPAIRSQMKIGSVIALPSRQAKVMESIPQVENLENSVNLLNVDNIEEKLMKEPSVLKSQFLKRIHKNTEVTTCDGRNEQKILNEQNAINEKLKHMDSKLDKTLNELANLKEIIKNFLSDRESLCRNCSGHCHTTNETAKKSSESTSTNNLENKVIQPTSEEECPETDSCVPESESKTYSLRRSLRLNNKGAQYAYESLRKSTKLLTTPRVGSARKTNTPGRISRKIIAQLNDLYVD